MSNVKQRRLTSAAVFGLLVGALFGAGSGASFAATSSTVSVYNSVSAYAFTTGSGTYKGGGIQVKHFLNAGAQSIGASSYLQKSNGAVCSSKSVTYTTAISLNRLSPYSSSACGKGQLRGGGKAYAYNGNGYTSKSISAPFENF